MLSHNGYMSFLAFDFLKYLKSESRKGILVQLWLYCTVCYHYMDIIELRKKIYPNIDGTVFP